MNIFVALVAISSATVIMGDFTTSEGESTTLKQSISRNDASPGGRVRPGNLCANYGTGQCCPLLNTINSSIQTGYRMQPCYVTFAPRAGVQNIDNICYTLQKLPQDANTYQLFMSTVYNDGSNTIYTSIVTQNQLGTYIASSPQCTFVDIAFGSVTDNVLKCDTGILYRCTLNGDCPRIPRGPYVPVFGLSFVRRKIPVGCWKLINDVILRNGFANQDFLSLPMKLPSRCVFPEKCTVSPVIQRFQKVAGFNYNQRLDLDCSVY